MQNGGLSIWVMSTKIQKSPQETKYIISVSPSKNPDISRQKSEKIRKHPDGPERKRSGKATIPALSRDSYLALPLSLASYLALPLSHASFLALPLSLAYTGY